MTGTVHVTNRGWCKSDEMTDYYAMAQLVPGVIAINTSMLIGNRLRGWMGTVVAMLGVVFVPFLVILAYAILFDNLSHLSFLSRAMGGLRPAVAKSTSATQVLGSSGWVQISEWRMTACRLATSSL